MFKYFLHSLEIALSQVTRVFRIKSNRIVCDSVNSVSQFADSPRYIAEYLLDKSPGKYEIVWLSDDVDRLSYLEYRGIQVIKRHSLKDFYYSNTASVFIGNLFGAPPYVAKRKGRMIIETTHGVAYKSLVSGIFKDSCEEGDYRWERAFSRRRINRCDLCLSGSRITSDIVYRNELGYRGSILENGLPRNDIFFRDTSDERFDVRRRLCVAPDEKIVLFMPTWRKEQGRNNIELDYRAITNSFAQFYGGNWKALLRLHPLTNFDYSDILNSYSDCLLDVTSGYDSQELLCAADVLVTDYSSVIWDFSLQGKPILLFQPDLGDYEKERGFNVPPSDWMLPVARNSEEIIDHVKNNTIDELCECAKRHLERFGSYETGHATEAVCTAIESHILHEKNCNRIERAGISKFAVLAVVFALGSLGVLKGVGIR